MAYTYDSTAREIKALFSEKLGISNLYDITDPECREVFILPSFRAAYSSLGLNDYSRWHLKGDAVLDLFIIEILEDRNFNGSITEEKKRLVGNEKNQPLNVLFDEWKLERFILAAEPLDTHKKANVVEAIFGLLYHKKLLKKEDIEKLFARFLPEKAAKPAEKPKNFPSVEEIAASSPEAIEALIKLSRDQVRVSSKKILTILHEKIVTAELSGLPTLIQRINIIQPLYGEHIFPWLVKDDRISIEKFGRITGKADKLEPFPPYSSIYSLSDLEKSPQQYFKLKLHYRFSPEDCQRLVEAWLNNLAKASTPEDIKAYTDAINDVMGNIQNYEILETKFNALSKDKQALFPKLQPLAHIANYRGTQEQINKLIDLKPEEFKALAALLKNDGYIARHIKIEINQRIAPPTVTDKTRRHYQALLDCFEQKPAAATALPMASAMAGAGASSVPSRTPA